MLPLDISRPTPNAKVHREDGFTLNELLVVILIVGILSAIAVPVFLNQKQTVGAEVLKSDLSGASIPVGLEYWKAPNRATSLTRADFPSVQTTSGTTWDVVSGSVGFCLSAWNPGTADHKTQAEALSWEAETGDCAALGVTGDVA